jgi:small-conductance mechanosensitive channel
LEETQVSRSRFETLAPILRVLLGVAIFITAVMMVLTSLGFNVMPLMAGASVVGLAISFGHDALALPKSPDSGKVWRVSISPIAALSMI